MKIKYCCIISFQSHTKLIKNLKFVVRWFLPAVWKYNESTISVFSYGF